MFSHVMVGSNDLDRSKRFYDAVLAELGAGPGIVDARGRIIYMHAGSRFLVTAPIDGQPATVANGNTIGFAVESSEQGEAWHAAGLAHGGTAIEDPPGVRDRGSFRAFLAYMRDPDGHKLCAMKML